MGLRVSATTSRKGAPHDRSPPANDGGHADKEFVSEHPRLVCSAGLPVRTPLLRSPIELSAEAIRTYQVYLMNERKLSPGSITIAISAIRFLYKVTLKKDWNLDEAIPACKKPLKLPTILSQDGVRRLLGCITTSSTRDLDHRYAAGLQDHRSVQLKPAAIDSKRMVLKVEQGKGQKDRYVMLSPQLLDSLRDYWRLPVRRTGCFLAMSPGGP